MARDNAKTVLYFTVTGVPSAAELVEIAALENTYRNVRVMRGDVPAGLAAGELIPGDALAGTVPTVYSDAVADYPDGILSVGADSKPEALLILPSATPSIAANGGTVQLRLVKANLNQTTNVVTLTDITAGAESAWSSGTPAKATVDADTGIVTGANAGAGSTIITATVTYDTDKTMTATRTVTVT